MGSAAASDILLVAIIGGGPAGLGAAIALSKLPNVEVKIFEQAKELREIGAGIRIGYNCWKVLNLLDADDDVRGHRKTSVYHRNGLDGDLIGSTSESQLPPRQQPHRVRRTRLQSALVAKVPPGVIELRKRLQRIENLPEGVKLTFEDGTVHEADIVVGADGIRSAVRDSVFPKHKISFTGTTIWRTLIPISLVSHLPDINTRTTWWHGRAGHVYTSPVDDPAEVALDKRMLEISCRNLVDPATDRSKRFSWGIPATNERVQSHFTDFDPRVRDAMSQAPQGYWKEFSAFAGPRLEEITAWDKVALLGDASHPLSGAFGSGAAFALEDGWILAKAIEYTGVSKQRLPEALGIFDKLRSPYYARMYQYLDKQKALAQQLKAANPGKEFEASLQFKAESLSGETKLPWIYLNDIEVVWQRFLELQSRGPNAYDKGAGVHVATTSVAIGVV